MTDWPWLAFGTWGILTFLGVGNGMNPFVAALASAALTAVLWLAIGFIYFFVTLEV